MTLEEIEKIHEIDAITRFDLSPKCDHKEYRELHSELLISTSIKIDVPLFQNTMQKYTDYFKPWSKNRPEMLEIRTIDYIVNTPERINTISIRT